MLFGQKLYMKILCSQFSAYKTILVKKVVVIQPLPTNCSFRHLKITIPVLAHAEIELGVKAVSGFIKITNEGMLSPET